VGNFWHGNTGSVTNGLGGHTLAEVQAWQITVSAPKVDVGGFNAGTKALDQVEKGRERAVGSITLKIRHDVEPPTLTTALLTLLSRVAAPHIKFLGSAIFDNLPFARRRGDEADTVEIGFELYSDWAGPTLVEA